MNAHGWRERLFAFCRAALCALFLLVLVPIAAAGLTTVAVNRCTATRFSQTVTLGRLSPAPTLALCAAALAAMLLLRRLLERFARIRLSAALTALWTLASILWVLAVGVRQSVDSQVVLSAAEAFARGDYAPLREPYLNVCGYQLRICLPLELLARLFPALDADLLTQCVQAVLGAAEMGVMAALCALLAGQARAHHAAYALYLTFLPAFFFCTFIYNVQLMLLLASGAMLCFALYVRRGRLGYGVGYAVLAALAASVKLNATIPLLALLICAVLHAILRRDKRILACAALSLALAMALPWAISRQYELRSGVTLRREDVSMTSRLAMALQDDSSTAMGWFNGYIDPFFDLSVSPEEERAAGEAALDARLREMAENPAETLAFFREKCLTQWLEPAYDILWWGNRCAKEGRFNGVGYAVYRETGAPYRFLLALMTLHQRTVYLLALLGAAVALRRRGDASQFMLPATILGGFLFHMLFEAKAQYIYVYAFYMMPLSAQGLCAVEDALAGLKRRLRG